MVIRIPKGDSVQFVFPAYHDETASQAHIRNASGSDLLSATVNTQVGYGLGIRPVQPVVTPIPGNQRSYGIFTGSFSDSSTLEPGEYYVVIPVSGLDVDGNAITHTRTARFYVTNAR